MAAAPLRLLPPRESHIPFRCRKPPRLSRVDLEPFVQPHPPCLRDNCWVELASRLVVVVVVVMLVDA